MKTRILNSSRAPFDASKLPVRTGLNAGRFTSHRAPSLEPTPRFALGSLWDPTLVDRLSLPLSRIHE